MGTDFDFSALTEVDDTVREEILEELPPRPWPRACANSIPTTPSTFSRTSTGKTRSRFSSNLPAAERVVARAQPLYPEDSAGRRMQTEFIAVPPSWNCRAGHRLHTRNRPICRSASRSFYVVDPDQKLHGRGGARPVAAHQAPGADGRSAWTRIAAASKATDDQEAVARMFERYDLVAAPVVDDGDRLVGVLTFDDIVDVIEEEAEEDIMALGGVGSQEELSGLGLDHRQEPVHLAVRQSADGSAGRPG